MMSNADPLDRRMASCDLARIAPISAALGEGRNAPRHCAVSSMALGPGRIPVAELTSLLSWPGEGAVSQDR